MGTRADVQLLFKDEGYGLTRDAAVLSRALRRLGLHVIATDTLGARDDPVTAGVNMFLEAISPAWLPHATRNILVPNPEWTRPDTEQALAAMDAVFCKTASAQRAFEARHGNVLFIGFTTCCLRPPSARKDFRRYLHVAGKSPHKGTRVLLECWAAHPEWPPLRVVAQLSDLGVPRCANIVMSRGYIPAHVVARMQNAHGVHVCPSECEGYGHTIVEGMAVGSVVVTTNGAPMNELVQDGRGVLIRPMGHEPLRAGTRWLIDPVALSETLCRVFAAPIEELREYGHTARRWLQENDAAFQEQLASAMRTVL